MQKIFSRSRPFSLKLYLLVVFGLSWPFQIASVLWSGGHLLLIYILNSMAMVMVLAATFLLGNFVFEDGFAGVGWRWGNRRQYMAVIVLVLLLFLVPGALDLAWGRLHLPGSVSSEQLMPVCILLFVTLLSAFGEEFGWRGYMLPHLAMRMSARQAVLVHAVIWWVWHLPLLLGQSLSALLASASQLDYGVVAVVILTTLCASFIGSIAHGVVFAYIWMRSRSLGVVSVYHAAFTGVRDTLSITIGLSALTTWWSTTLVLLIGLGLIWRGDWRGLQPKFDLPGQSGESENGERMTADRADSRFRL